MSLNVYSLRGYATISRMRRRWAIFLVVTGAFLVLAWHSSAAGIATGYVDPLAGIQAQDEAFYGAISYEMADHGDWLTPRFVGRYAFTKPPF